MPESCVRGKWCDEKRKEGRCVIREYIVGQVDT